METYDVFSYGVVASSTLFLLKDRYPARSGYAELGQRYQNIGGEAANSTIVLSRLGLKVKLDGNWVNPDADADFLRDVFDKNHVDISRLTFQSCQGAKEVLMVDANSRTIFGTYAQLAEEKSWNSPHKIDIQNAKVVSLDPFFGKASLQVAEYAQSYNKPVVTVDCKFNDPVFLRSDTAIISEEYLKHTYPDHSPPAVMHKYREGYDGTVIFTFGHQEIHYSARGQEFERMTPYQIDPVDTTGAGDSLRAGVIYGLVMEWQIEETIAFASALAAIVCESIPGVLNSPGYDQVKSLMDSYQSIPN
jgi:sugar/nucleoside kinase (ribokinase family)